MLNAERYSFTSADTTLGEAGLQPYLPISLVYQDQSVTALGLIDTDAMVNVFEEPIGKLLLDNRRVRLLVFDLQMEVIRQWIP